MPVATIYFILPNGNTGGINISTSDPQSRTDGQLSNKKKTREKKTKSNFKFIITMVIVSFLLSVTFSYTSSSALNDASTVLTFFVLVLFILIGVLFDIVGTATTSADIKTFNSMAARRVSGAKEGIWLVKNAEKTASFCNDVIGDICGIMSGTTGALITVEIISVYNASPIITPLLVTGFVAACTIGGKAMGKSAAVSGSDSVVFFVGKTIYYIKSVKKIFGKRG